MEHDVDNASMRKELTPSSGEQESSTIGRSNIDSRLNASGTTLGLLGRCLMKKSILPLTCTNMLEMLEMLLDTCAEVFQTREQCHDPHAHTLEKQVPMP